MNACIAMIVTECAKLEMWDCLQNVFLRNNKLYDINESDEDGNTLLHILAAKRRDELLKTVLAIGSAQVNARNHKGATALHMAARIDSASTARLLLARKKTQNDEEPGADPNIADMYGETPVFNAVRRNCPDMIQIFYEFGGRMDVINRFGFSLMHVAAKMNSIQSAKLLHRIADQSDLRILYGLSNKCGFTALQLAVRHNHHQITDYMLKQEIGSTKAEHAGNEVLLLLAAQNNNYLLAVRLLNAGCEVNAGDRKDGVTALHMAVEGHRRDLVELFLERGGNPNKIDADGYTSVHICSQSGHTSILNLLLR